MSNCNSTHLPMVVIVPRNAENDTGHLKSGFPDTWAVTVLRRSPGYLYYTWIAHIFPSTPSSIASMCQAHTRRSDDTTNCVPNHAIAVSPCAEDLV